MPRPLTVRDLRLHWPEAEQRLKRERELVVTRDGQPVARLIAYEPEQSVRPRWSADRHVAWLKRTWKVGAKSPSTDELLAEERDE